MMAGSGRLGDLEASLAYEMLGFFGPDLREGMSSHVESAHPVSKRRSPL